MDLDIAAAQLTPAQAHASRDIARLASPAVPIASLTPVRPVPPAASLRAVVALIYPYSSATGTLALLLTEPDFRLRLRRGQVRVQFRGPAARAVAGAKVGIGDAVSLDLKGGKWVESSGVGTPGRGVEGELVFQNFVQLEVEREGQRVASVQLDEPEVADVGDADSSGPAETPMLSRVRTVDENAEHASPAFWRGKRVTSGGFSVVAVDPFADVTSRDEHTPSKRRKSWRFIQQSESPEGDDTKTQVQEQASTPIVMIDDETYRQSQDVMASSPTPAPPASRPDAILAPLNTTNLQPQPQVAPPLSTPTFLIPSMPPAPPSLQPVQSPALPLVSPFTSIPPPEARNILTDGEALSPLPVTSAGISVEYSSMTATDQDLPRQVEIEDYFAYPTQEQQAEKELGDVHFSDFVEFEHERHSAPPPPDAAEARHSLELVDLPGDTGISQPSDAPNQTTRPVTGMEDQFFDFTAATQAPTLQQHDQLVESSNFHDQTPQPIFSDELGPSQISERKNEPVSTHDSRPSAHDGALPSPMRDVWASQDSKENLAITPTSSQLPKDLPTQDTLHTSIPVPMLPTPATSQNRLLEMIEDPQRLPDAMDLDKEPLPEPEPAQEQSKDLERIEPFTPGPPMKRTHSSDVPAILSPWFSSRGSSHRKRVEERTPIRADTEDAVHEDQLSEAMQPSQRFEQQLNKVANGLRTRLAYFTPLASLQAHLNASSQHTGLVDVLAMVSSASSLPKRAKGGPRDYFTIFHVADQTYASDPVQVQVLRPYKASLPTVERGDVILLRDFAVKSVKRECILLSGEASSWCAWRVGSSNADESYKQDESSGALSPDLALIAAREECKGPPVEVEDEERTHVLALRFWWSANQQGVPDRVK